jgi:hypothetical protein
MLHNTNAEFTNLIHMPISKYRRTDVTEVTELKDLCEILNCVPFIHHSSTSCILFKTTWKHPDAYRHTKSTQVPCDHNHNTQLPTLPQRQQTPESRHEILAMCKRVLMAITKKNHHQIIPDQISKTVKSGKCGRRIVVTRVKACLESKRAEQETIVTGRFSYLE